MSTVQTQPKAPGKPITAITGETVSKPKSTESKADKFRRLANQRVNASIRRLLYVANLANRSSYDYTDEQALRVCEAISAAANGVVAAFQRKEQASTGWQL